MLNIPDNLDAKRQESYSEFHDYVEPFFIRVFPELDRNQYIEIRHAREGDEHLQRDFFATIDDAIRYTHLRLGRHVWYGVCPRDYTTRMRDGKEYQFGGRDAVGVMFWVWADLDYRHVPKEELDHKLNDFPVKPNILVCSGGGYQPLWRLKTPISDIDEMNLAEEIMERMTLHFGNHNPMDRVWDRSRILRLPGTYNWKEKYGNPRPVTYQVLREEGTTLDELDIYLPPLKEQRRNSSPSHLAMAANPITTTRNIDMTSYVGTLWATGVLDKNEVAAAALERNRKMLNPDGECMDDDEVLRVVKSITERKVRGIGRDGSPWNFGQTSQGPEGPLNTSWDPYLGPSNDWLEVKNLLALDDPGRTKWVVKNLFPSMLPFGYYGASGSIKTFLSIHLAICLLNPDIDDYFGFPIPTLKNILFVDYELDEKTVLRRVHKVLRGMHMDPSSFEGRFFYYNGKKAPSRDTSLLGALQVCKENSIEMAMIDSFGFAMGGDQESQNAVMEFQRKLEVFNNEGIELFMTEHPPRPIKGEKLKDKDVFGSVYKRAWMRGLVQIRRTEESKGKDYADIVVDAKKVSEGREQPEFTIRALFDNEQNTVTFRRLDDGETPEESPNANAMIFEAYKALGKATVNQVFQHVNQDNLDKPTIQRKTVQNETANLRKSGKIEEVGKEGRAPIYAPTKVPDKGPKVNIGDPWDPRTLNENRQLQNSAISTKGKEMDASEGPGHNHVLQTQTINDQESLDEKITRLTREMISEGDPWKDWSWKDYNKPRTEEQIRGAWKLLEWRLALREKHEDSDD